MKQLLLSLTAICLSMGGYSQNTFPASGNAGIGTLSPSNVPGYSTLTINSQSGIGGLLDFQQGGNSLHAITGNHGGLFLMAHAGKPIYLWTDGNEKMSILANGNVGLGNHLPQSRLEVSGPSTSYGAAGTFHLSGNQAWGHVVTLATDNPSGDDPRLLFSYRNNAKHWAVGGSGNTSTFGIWEDGGDGIYGTDFGTQRFSILPGGNVGIGISNPAEKLAVNGTIRSREVKVENLHWPDYVFEKDYQLPSLAEVYKHIQEQGHLPGIPSADEVKANGIALGDMDARLLKKIEELTLYLIQKEEELKAQKTLLNQQQSLLNNFQLQMDKLNKKL